MRWVMSAELISANAANLISYARHVSAFDPKFGRTGHRGGKCDLRDAAFLCISVHFRAKGFAIWIAKIAHVPRDEGLMRGEFSILPVETENKEIAISEWQLIVIELFNRFDFIGTYFVDCSVKHTPGLIGGA